MFLSLVFWDVPYTGYETSFYSSATVWCVCAYFWRAINASFCIQIGLNELKRKFSFGSEWLIAISVDFLFFAQRSIHL